MAGREKLELALGCGMRLILGGLFLWAGYLKLKDPILFAEDIRNYRIVGDPWVAMAAVVLPWVEIFTGLGVLLKRLYLGSILTLACLLSVFAVALGSAWIRGLDINCGCFGGEESTNYGLAILRNMVLLGICGGLLVLELRRGVPEPTGSAG